MSDWDRKNLSWRMFRNPRFGDTSGGILAYIFLYGRNGARFEYIRVRDVFSVGYQERETSRGRECVIWLNRHQGTPAMNKADALLLSNIHGEELKFRTLTDALAFTLPWTGRWDQYEPWKEKVL